MQPEMSASIEKCDQTRVATSFWIKRVGAVLLSGLIMVLGLIAPQLVQAGSNTASPSALVVVNTAVDENDGSCSDDCSLRDAIAVAANGDSITFSGSYTIYLNSQLQITKTLTIDGSGHTVKVSGDTGGDGTPNVRGFYIDNTGVVTLTNLNIISGRSSGNDGGGIYNRGALTVQNSTLSGNSAGLSGGGIYNSGGTLTVQNSTLSGNSAFYGGGLYNNFGTLTVQNSTLSGNSAGWGGGGLYNQSSSTLNLYNTLIANSPSGGDCANANSMIGANDHNLIEGNGGACDLTTGVNGNIVGVDPLLAPLDSYGGDTDTFALLPGSPALNAGNSATCLSTDQRGVVRPQPSGGTCDIGAFESRGFTLTYGSGSDQSTPGDYLFTNPLSLTVTGSLSEPVNGGQVVLTGPGSGAGTNPPVNTVSISGGAVTQMVRANHTTGSYTVSADTRGNLGSTVSFSLTNLTPKMVVLGNGVVIAYGDTSPSAADGTDFGYVIMGETIITHTFTISNSGLFSLPINGLSLSGPAAGDFVLSGLTIPVTLPVNSAVTFQVRFDPTSTGTRAATITLTSDGGPENAYNFAIQGVSGNRLIVINANDSGAGSLRQAIADAADDDTITFAGNYTIYLSSTLVITERLIIDGSGHTVTVSGDTGGDGTPNVRVLSIGSSGVVTLTHLNIISGTANSEANGYEGGGIRNYGTLTLRNSTLSGNSAHEGGGIYNDGSLNIQNSTLSGNSASGWGGGIVNVATLTIQNSTFANNSAVTYDGGGIDNLGGLTMQNSTLSGNSAHIYGGGIYNDGGTATAIIRNSTFYGNSSEFYSGGGISNEGTLTVQNSTLSGNSAYIYGGGIYNLATLNLSNTLIANNDWQDCANESGGTVGTNDHNLIEGVGSNACGLVNGVNGNLIGLDPLLGPSGNYGGNTQTIAPLPGSPAIDAGNACLTTDQRGIARPQVAACDIGAFESQGFNLTVTGGNGQSTPVHLAFSDPLSLIVSSSFGEPVDGGQVIFTGPGNGAGINPPIYTATISSGAVTQIVRANGTSGSYSVAADTRGRLGSAAGFNLTNLALKTVVLGNGLVIADGDTTPSLADHTDFGGVTPGFSLTRTFTISNSSTASLTITSLSLSGAGAGDFALSGPALPVTLTANSAITFQVRFTPAIFATSTATITLATDDGPENDYDFAIQGAGVCANPMNVTNANDSGAGSLRQAIALVCNGGTIDFAADTALYLNSPLEITKTLTIDGSGRTVNLSGDSLGDGTPNVRVLSIGSSGVVTLTHLTIISGTANSEASNYEGGGIRNGGALVLQDSTLSGNSATNYGGGIYNSGTLIASDSTLSGNLAEWGGGGIYNTSGRITVTNSTLSGNSADFVGGGIDNESGALALQNSTLTGNSADYYGGGIYNTSGRITVTNSTLSGNSVGNTEDDIGGGIYNYGSLTLQNTTLSGNWGGIGGGIANGGTLNLHNTLIANSLLGGDCRNSGTLGANDHNLMQSTLVTDTCGLSNGAGGSLIGVNPQLDPLGTYGGDTQTFRLQSGSPAIDAGNNATCLSTDQRGVARPQGAACDIGAYEVAKLGLAKSVTPETHVLHHGVVTYTLVLGLSQGDVLADPNIILTDALPAQVLFGSWVISPANTMQAGNAITWTGALTAGNAITFTFTGTYAGGLSKWVTNTATFSGTTGAGSAAAGFQVAHVITPTAGAGGSITPDTPQTVDHGESITFTIAPAAGYHIADVGVDGISQGVLSSYTFSNVTASHTITAAFALNTYTITPTAGAGGSITPDTPQAVSHGGSITFTIAPAVSYHILDVGVDGASLGAVSIYTFVNVTADHTISATFALNEHLLTVGVNGQGQVTRTPDQSAYLYGSVVTLTATPALGWYFGQWLGDASGVLTQTTVSMDANKVVTATFFNTSPTYYTLTLGLFGSGTITPTAGAHSYLSGTLVDLSATPAPGWQFAGWTGDADCADGSVIMNANKICTATFALYRVYLPLILR